MTRPAPQPIALTLEDVAHLVDASDEIPDDTAVRLRTFIRCDSMEQVLRTWHLIGSHREALRQMAEDAGLEGRVDAAFVFRIFGRLRSRAWEQPEDVLPRGVEMPYRELISMVVAHAHRAEATERDELEGLLERLHTASEETAARHEKARGGKIAPCN